MYKPILVMMHRPPYLQKPKSRRTEEQRRLRGRSMTFSVSNGGYTSQFSALSIQVSHVTGYSVKHATGFSTFRYVDGMNGMDGMNV